MSADNHIKKMAACYYAEYFQAAFGIFVGLSNICYTDAK